MDLEKIPVGHRNAMSRPSNPNDIEDEVEFNEYMAKELHRARAIQKKRLSMKLTYERWREVGVLTNYTRQAAEP